LTDDEKLIISAMSYDETEDLGGVPEGYTADEDVLSSAFENYWDEIQKPWKTREGPIGLPTARFTLNSSALFHRETSPFAWRTEKLLRKGQSDGDLLTDEQLLPSLLTSRLSSRNYLFHFTKVS